MCKLKSFKSWKKGDEYWVVLEVENCPGKLKGGGGGLSLKNAIWDAFFDTGLRAFLNYSQLQEVDFSETKLDVSGKNIAETIVSFINDNALVTI